MNDNNFYRKINYNILQSEINNLKNNKELIQKLDIKFDSSNYTEYMYPIDIITIGSGEKEILLVGGTHGSEIISVDFMMYILKNLNRLDDLDTSKVKITIIPTINPEGFDITTSNLKNIHDEEFLTKSKEYYLRYRTDDLIRRFMNEFNNFFQDINKDLNVITSQEINQKMIEFLRTNPASKLLNDNRAMPNFEMFIKLMEFNGNNESLEMLKHKLLFACNTVIDKNEIFKDLASSSLVLFMNMLKKGFSSELLWQDIITNTEKKLHQIMFEKEKISSLQNKMLEIDANKIMENNPIGSQIAFDPTGIGVNLNENTPYSPGINAMKNNDVVYAPGSRNNVRNYFPGPIGFPTKDPNNFEFTKENNIILNLVSSADACILYHGTGGMIFHVPNKELTKENDYEKFKKYNSNIANIIGEKNEYAIKDSNGTISFTDYITSKYPGVLLVELSKMGGNPIAPYGDENNIYKVFEDNFQSVISLYQNMQNNNIETINKKGK